jgi:hypothetical protein
MKLIYSTFILSLFLVSCMPVEKEEDNSADLAFEQNSKTVMTFLEGYQNESLDYDALYSDDYLMRGTWQGGSDSISAEQVMEDDKNAWAKYDYEIITDPIILLPGVSVDTKEPDGSVRYYATWKITKTATDSTEAKSANMKLYESFDFDEDGKILYQQFYGDFGGLRKALHSEE